MKIKKLARYLPIRKSGNKGSLFIGVILLFFDFVIKYKLAFYDRLEVLSGD